MVSILFITGLILLFGILLGPYRVVLILHGHEAEVTGTLRLAGLKQIFGFVWILSRQERIFRTVFLNRFVLIQRRKVILPAYGSFLIKNKKKEEEKGKRKVHIGCLLRRGSSRFSAWTQTILRSMSFQKFEATGEFGFVDPAVTGLLYGWICACRSFGGAMEHVDLRPNFSENRFHGECMIIFRAVLIVLMVRLARTGMEFYRLIRSCRASMKGK